MNTINPAATQQQNLTRDLGAVNERAETARQEATGQSSADVAPQRDTVEISAQAEARQADDAEQVARDVGAFLTQNEDESLSVDSQVNEGRLEILA